MSAPVRLGIALPQAFPDGPVDPRTIRKFVERAEAVGCFESVWVQEGILSSLPSLDPLHLLTYTAACSEQLRLGCAVLLTALHSPVHLAKALSTLDCLSQGRLIVGVGLGASTGMYPAFAADPASRVARFRESIQILKILWTEPRTTFEGRFWKLKDAPMQPKPVQKPHPPIWFGGSHPNALRRAVELGNGYVGAGSSSTADFVERVSVIRRLLDEAGRDPREFEISKRVYMAIDQDKARAGRLLGERYELRYGRRNFEPVSVWGSPGECTERLLEVAEAGAEILLLTPMYDELEQMERIVADIVPHLVR